MIPPRLRIGAPLLAILAIGCAAPPAAPHVNSAQPSASSTVSSAQTESAPVADAIPTLVGEDRVLDAGTYRLGQDVIGVGSAPILVTVPDGWIGGGAFFWVGAVEPTPADPPPVGVMFWNVDQVYGHPCDWQGTLTRPGPTVGDLTAAIVDRPLRNATTPIDVAIDGYAGQYLEWSVPVDLAPDFADCDADGGRHYFESWTGKGSASDRYHQGPGQVDRLWILDVDGHRVVIDAQHMPSATTEQLAQLQDVIDSIRFER